MSDDFGAISSKRGGERSREIDLLRMHYRKHREALAALGGDAPSEHLAGEYHRLIAEIDMAVRKLDELGGGAATPGAASSDTNPAFRPKTRPGQTAPGTRPLVRTEEPATVYARDGANP